MPVVFTLPGHEEGMRHVLVALVPGGHYRAAWTSAVCPARACEPVSL